MTARVVHVSSDEWRNTPEDQREYVGRAMPRQRMAGSVFGNPFHVDPKAGFTAEHAVRQYAGFLALQPDLLARLPELKSKVLGCWCQGPKTPNAPCHGAILAVAAELGRDDVVPYLREVAQG